jgi:hypothetical protein
MVIVLAECQFVDGMLIVECWNRCGTQMRDSSAMEISDTIRSPLSTPYHNVLVDPEFKLMLLEANPALHVLALVIVLAECQFVDGMLIVECWNRCGTQMRDSECQRSKIPSLTNLSFGFHICSNIPRSTCHLRTDISLEAWDTNQTTIGSLSRW